MGTLEGEKAKKMRNIMRMTGTDMRTTGGGGSGGRTSGRARRHTVNIKIVVTMITDFLWFSNQVLFIRKCYSNLDDLSLRLSLNIDQTI